MKVSFFAPYGVFLSMLLKRSAIVDMTQILCENKDYNIFPHLGRIHLISLSYMSDETVIGFLFVKKLSTLLP